MKLHLTYLLFVFMLVVGNLYYRSIDFEQWSDYRDDEDVVNGNDILSDIPETQELEAIPAQPMEITDKRKKKMKPLLETEVDSEDVSKISYPTNQFVFYSPDIHAGTRIDLATSLTYLNQSIVLSSQARGFPRYFRSPIRVTSNLDRESNSPQIVMPKKAVIGKKMPLDVQSESVLMDRFDSVREHPAFANVDCVVCMFYPAQCQFFIAFNKTVVFLPAHRFLINRCTSFTAKSLMRAMFSDKPNVMVLAASVYDAEYIRYFSGRSVPIIFSSSLFAYPEPSSYAPEFEEILVAPLKYVEVPYLEQMEAACKRRRVGCSFTTVLKKVGRGWKFPSLFQFKAVVVFPYAVLSYYLNDLMAACVPMFVPSPAFLLELGIMKDVRNRDKVYCGESFVPPSQHPDSHHPFSPEDDSRDAQLYWLRYSSFYSDATVVFESWDDLAMKLKRVNKTEMFWKRKEENRRIREHNIREWEKVFEKIDKHRVLSSSYMSAREYFRDMFYFFICYNNEFII